MGVIRLVNWWRQARWYFMVSVLCSVGISVAAWMHEDNLDWFVFLLFLLLPAAMVAVGCAYGGRQRRLDWLTPLTVAACHVALLCCVFPKEQWLQPEYLVLFAYACLPGGLLLLVLLFFWFARRLGPVAGWGYHLALYLLCVPGNLLLSLGRTAGFDVLLALQLLGCALLTAFAVRHTWPRGWVTMLIWTLLCGLLSMLLQWQSIHVGNWRQVLMGITPPIFAVLLTLSLLSLWKRFRPAAPKGGAA